MINTSPSTARLTVKVLHISFIVAVLIYGILLFGFLSHIDFGSIFPPDDPIFIIMEGTLGIISVVILVLGYYLPRWAIKWCQQEVRRLVSVHIVRLAFFESVGIFGLILGVLGAQQEIPLLFLLVSAVALILTFPTEEKWKKTLKSIGLDPLEEF